MKKLTFGYHKESPYWYSCFWKEKFYPFNDTQLYNYFSNGSFIQCPDLEPAFPVPQSRPAMTSARFLTAIGGNYSCLKRRLHCFQNGPYSEFSLFKDTASLKRSLIPSLVQSVNWSLDPSAINSAFFLQSLLTCSINHKQGWERNKLFSCVKGWDRIIRPVKSQSAKAKFSVSDMHPPAKHS